MMAPERQIVSPENEVHSAAGADSRRPVGTPNPGHPGVGQDWNPEELWLPAGLGRQHRWGMARDRV